YCRAPERTRSRTWIGLLALAVLSCSGMDRDRTDHLDEGRVGTAREALVDVDGDGMDDAWESQYFGNLSQTGTGDYDVDGMTNAEEYNYGFNPTVDDGFADADGDRYPNVFEIRRGADPSSSSSVPTSNYVVNAAGGGTHT